MSDVIHEVHARLRLADGREFDVVDGWPGPLELDPGEQAWKEGLEYFWSDGNHACDCNRARLLNEQHGLSLPQVCGDEAITLVSLKVKGVEYLSGPEEWIER